MVSIHKQRAAHRAAHEDPENVSIILEGITKVITWEEYKAMEEYFPTESKEGEEVDAPTEEVASS